MHVLTYVPLVGLKVLSTRWQVRVKHISHQHSNSFYDHLILHKNVNHALKFPTNTGQSTGCGADNVGGGNGDGSNGSGYGGNHDGNGNHDGGGGNDGCGNDGHSGISNDKGGESDDSGRAGGNSG